MPLSKLGMFCGIILIPMHIKTCLVRGHLNNHSSSKQDSVQELFHFFIRAVQPSNALVTHSSVQRYLFSSF